MFFIHLFLPFFGACIWCILLLRVLLVFGFVIIHLMLSFSIQIQACPAHMHLSACLLHGGWAGVCGWASAATARTPAVTQIVLTYVLLVSCVRAFVLPLLLCGLCLIGPCLSRPRAPHCGAVCAALSNAAEAHTAIAIICTSCNARQTMLSAVFGQA